MRSSDSTIFYDGLFDFSKGMDSNTHPLLLPPNTASFLTNSTVRGTFLSNRPAFNKITFNYNGDASAQSMVEGGLWQGACFYNPDTGPQCLIASISGRLFQFSLGDTTATVTDISIPGDFNSAAVTQCWLWQAENYVIINDGIHLPIFYNGTSSRRSNGAEVLLATVQNSFTAPAIGSPVVVTLTTAYTGPLNTAVMLTDSTSGNAFYQTVAAGASYFVNLVNVSGNPGDVIASGQNISIRPSLAGVLWGPGTSPGTTVAGGLHQLTFASKYLGSFNVDILYGGYLWTVLGIYAGDPSGNSINFTFHEPFGANIPGVPGYTPIPYSSNSSPDVVVVTLAAPITLPAIGGSVQAQVASPYAGTPGQVVYHSGTQFTITAVPPGPATTQLTLININDPPGTNHVPAVGPPEVIVTINSIPELPTSRMGAYGMGRNWISLTDGLSFLASDIVGGPSGTPVLQGRDAVLRVTENSYLFGGGVFRIPSSGSIITAMIFGATIDSSLGQGALQVYTPNIAFSCNAPVDRATWQKLTNPILTESLISNGALGQNSTVVANGDTMFRAVDGIRSLILGQRQFSTWGNVPLSIEMNRVLELDIKSLLNYGSSIIFDNRLLMTCSPQTSGKGVYHQGLIALNFDPLASVDEKTQPLFDGLWTGLNTLQLVTGVVNGIQRGFAFTLNLVLGHIELYEITPDPDIKATDSFDNAATPITFSMESASLFKSIKGKGPFDLARLMDGELYVDNVIGKVDFQVYYKPDQYPCWTPWYSWSICNKVPNPQTPLTGTNTVKPGFRHRMGLGMPSADQCDPNTGFAMREGCTFQVKIVITGACRFIGGKFAAASLPEVLFAKPVCDAICK